MTCDVCGKKKRTRTYEGIKDSRGFQRTLCLDCKYQAHADYRDREGLRPMSRQEYMNHNGWNR